MATLNLSITVPDKMANEVLTDFTDFHGYQAEVLDEKSGEKVANPETRVMFMKKQMIQHLRDSVKTHRARKAVEQASNIDKVDLN